MVRFSAGLAMVLAVLSLNGGLVFAAEAEREDRPPLDPASIPAAGAAVAAFVPAGWRIEAEASGDLDRDGVADTVLTLVEDLPVEDADGMVSDRHRALVVLRKRAAGYVRAGSNGLLLLCTRCGGALFGVTETPVDVSIERGVVIVRQESGAREMTGETYRFRFDPKEGRMALIGLDLFYLDRLGPTMVEESTNLLTGDFVREESRIDEETGKETVSISRKKVPRKRLFLDEVRPRSAP
jgi:hypothetical protein